MTDRGLGDHASSGRSHGDRRAPFASKVRIELRALAASSSSWFRTTTYLRKWLVLGFMLGCVAGLGAVVFYEALGLATHLFLGGLSDYRIPTPSSEGMLAGSSHYVRAWSLPLVVGLGGLLSAIVVTRFAPEAEGHGTDAALAAVHENPRGVRARAVAVKIVASALTIGSGGSGGREGPIAQISAGFGSLLARTLDLSPADGRIAVAVGIGSGIGAIFSAPLGGALLAAEILYRDDIEVEAIIPALIAAVFSYTVFSAFLGFSPLFGFTGAGYQFSQPAQLGWYALIGVVGGGVGIGYAKGFHRIAELFGRLPLSRVARPAVGGVLTGAIAIALPEVLGTGYGWIQKGLGPELLTIPLWAVLLMPLGKIVATSCSIGSGGSGGIFGPGIVIGAFTGAALWRLLEPVAPGIPHSPAPFVVVGMMATFGGISRAPLAVMVMVAEMTGSLAMFAPALIAVGLATLIVRQADETIYRGQLRNRSESPAHRLATSMPLLSSMTAADVMASPRVVLSNRDTLGAAQSALDAAEVPGAPVVDERGTLVGVVTAARLEGPREGGLTAEVGRLADPTAPTLHATSTLDIALEALLHARSNWVPVLGSHREVTGILTTSSVVRGYRTGLRANLAHISQATHDVAVVDAVVGGDAPLAGLRLRDADLPVGTIVMTLQRGTDHLVPGGDTVVQAGDRVGVLTRGPDEDEVRRLIEGPRT